MNRYVLPKNIVITNAHSRRFAFVSDVLWRVSDDAAGVKLIAGADFRRASQIHVRPNLALRPNNHICIDDHIRTYARARINLGARMDNGRRVNHE